MIGCDIAHRAARQGLPRAAGEQGRDDRLRPALAATSCRTTIKAAGGVPKRDRVGHAFIKKTMAETKAVFGGELSGHFYFRDNFFADSARSRSPACCRSSRPAGQAAQRADQAAHRRTPRAAS